MDTESQELVPLAPRPIKGSSKASLILGPPDRLTKKQQMFVEHYLQGESAHKAALSAGYSPFTADVANTVILRNPQVMAELRRRADEYFKDLRIDTDLIIQEAAKMAFSNMFDYIEIQPDGTFKVDLTRCTRDMGSAIQELSYDPEGRPKIRLADKKASVELLARIKKLFSDSDDRGGNGKDAPLTIQSLDQIVQNVTVNQQFNIIPQERHDILEAATQ